MWAGEARVFSNGKIVAKVREAKEEEESRREEARTCDVWVDIFEDRKEADRFCRDYKYA